MNVSPRVEQPADPWALVKMPRLVTAYSTEAAVPSVSEQGTENIYKIYAESFRGADHLRRMLEEAQTIVGDALAAVPVPTRDEGHASSVRPQETVREAKEAWRNEATPH